MRARVLPMEEWDRLQTQNPDLLGMLRTIRPETARVFVVEDESGIVASWAKMQMTHLEGLKIDKRAAAIRLLRLAQEMIAEPWVVTGATTPEVKDMIVRFGGQQVPIETFVLSLKRERRVA